jgi:hypothetical protein
VQQHRAARIARKELAGRHELRIPPGANGPLARLVRAYVPFAPRVSPRGEPFPVRLDLDALP